MSTQSHAQLTAQLVGENGKAIPFTEELSSLKMLKEMFAPTGSEEFAVGINAALAENIRITGPAMNLIATNPLIAQQVGHGLQGALALAPLIQQMAAEEHLKDMLRPASLFAPRTLVGEQIKKNGKINLNRP